MATRLTRTDGDVPVVDAVVLAAGEGRRFGSPKQVHRIDGVSIVDRVIAAVRPVVTGRLVLALGAHAGEVRAGADLATDAVVEVAGWRAGPGVAVRAAVRALGDSDGLLIVVGDLPWLQVEACARVVARGGDVVRAVDGGRPGHPVMLRGPAVARAREAPDGGLGPLLADAVPVDCRGLGVAADIDTIDDLCP